MAKLEQQQITKAIDELRLRPEVAERLHALLSTYADLHADYVPIKQAMDIEQSKIGKLLADYGIDKTFTEQFNIFWVRGSTTSKLDPMKLLAQGVTNAQIEAATVTKPKKDYFQIRSKSASGDSPVDNG